MRVVMGPNRDGSVVRTRVHEFHLRISKPLNLKRTHQNTPPGPAQGRSNDAEMMARSQQMTKLPFADGFLRASCEKSGTMLDLPSATDRLVDLRSNAPTRQRVDRRS